MSYVSALSTRYASPAMQALWSERRRIGLWRRLWLALMEGQRELGLEIPGAAVEQLRAHVDDVGQEGMDVIREARVIFDNYDLSTEILAASIRHPRHVVEAAMIGADVATLPAEVLKKLLPHPLTDRGLDQFLNDWSKLAARAKASV